MINWPHLLRCCQDPALQQWIEQLRTTGRCVLSSDRHGDLPKWQAAVAALPRPDDAFVDLNQSAPCSRFEQTTEQYTQLQETLQCLHPWRKGPFDLGGVHIDTEWHSDFKWDRIAAHLAPLEDKSVLDVGSGNGYFCWRLAAAGAALALGIEPSPLFNLQFDACKKMLGQHHAHLLPLGIEAVPRDLRCFDTVLSMGVLYHRRDPIDHLKHLQQCLKPKGQLLLETLVVPGDENTVLVPEGRYARMRNVWFLPSVDALCRWLRRSGYSDVHCVDVNQTSLEEQRSTPWMKFESLPQCLDPNDLNRTLEDLPAPRRAIISAIAP